MTDRTFNQMLIIYAIVLPEELILSSGFQYTWRLTDDCQSTKVLFSPILRAAPWLGSFVEDKKNSNKLEKLQERAVRIVDEFHQVMKYCGKGPLLCLFLLSSSFLGTEMHKCIKETNPTQLNDLFSIQASDDQLCDSSRLIQPDFNNFKFGFKSVRYFGPKVWNVLPVDIKQSKSLSNCTTRITNGATAMLLTPWKRTFLIVSLFFYHVSKMMSLV